MEAIERVLKARLSRNRSVFENLVELVPRVPYLPDDALHSSAMQRIKRLLQDSFEIVLERPVSLSGVALDLSAGVLYHAYPLRFRGIRIDRGTLIPLVESSPLTSFLLSLALSIDVPTTVVSTLLLPGVREQMLEGEYRIRGPETKVEQLREFVETTLPLALLAMNTEARVPVGRPVYLGVTVRARSPLYRFVSLLVEFQKDTVAPFLVLHRGEERKSAMLPVDDYLFQRFRRLVEPLVEELASALARTSRQVEKLRRAAVVGVAAYVGDR